MTFASDSFPKVEEKFSWHVYQCIHIVGELTGWNLLCQRPILSLPRYHGGRNISWWFLLSASVGDPGPDPDSGSGRIRTFLPDPESSPPGPDPDLDPMYIYQGIVSKKMFLINFLKTLMIYIHYVNEINWFESRKRLILIRFWAGSGSGSGPDPVCP